MFPDKLKILPPEIPKHHLLPGDEVEIVKTTRQEFDHPTLDGKDDGQELLVNIFHGVVAAIPRQNIDTPSDWHIHEVSALDTKTGTFYSREDLFIAEGDSNFIIDHLNNQPSKNQLSLRIDDYGNLQLL